MEHRKNGLQRITDLRQSFMSMIYPLIHLYKEDGYMLGAHLVSQTQKTFTRVNFTMRHFYGYSYNALMAPANYYNLAGCCNNTLWMGTWQLKKKGLGTLAIINQSIEQISMVD